MKSPLIILLAIIFFISGCTATSTSGQQTRQIYSPKEFSEPVEVVFWHAMNGQQEIALTSLTQEYNESQDNVEVILENQGTYVDLQTKLSAAVSADTVPTMTMGYPNWMIEYDEQNFLVDLTAYFDNDTVGLDKSVYVDAFMQENNINNKYLGIPFNKSSEVIYYNKDLFDQAGVQPPKSLDELIDVSNTITEKTQKVGSGYEALNNYLAVAIRECEIQTWVNEESKSLINDPCVVQKVKLYQKGIEKGSMRIAGEDKYLTAPFGSGNLGMNITSTAGDSFIKEGVDGKFEYGVAPYPSKTVMQQGTNLMIFNSTKNSDQEISAAWDYIKFLTSDQSTTKWAMQSGYLPVTKAAYETDEYKKYMQENEVAKIAYEQMENMEVLVPVFKGSNEIFSVDFIDFMTKSLSKDTDIQSEMDSLSEKLEKAYSEN